MGTQHTTNGNGVLIKRVINILFAILLGILSFLSANFYIKLNDTIPEELHQIVQYNNQTFVPKDSFKELKNDIRDMNKKIDEINCYLRDNPRSSVIRRKPRPETETKK